MMQANLNLRDTIMFLLLYQGKQRELRDLQKNMVPYIPGIDLLNLDWSEVTVLWVNMWKGKGMWTRPRNSCLHLPYKGKSHFGVEEA